MFTLTSVKMYITLVWNDQQSFYLHHCHIIILPVLFCVYEISIHCFVIELQYDDIFLMILNYIHYITYSLNFEVIMNVNRLSVKQYLLISSLSGNFNIW